MKIKLFEQFAGIENKARLSDSIVKLLNEQIENELYSSQLYRSMSCWMDDKGWTGGVKLFKKYAQEELVHMEKIYDYLFDKNCKAVTPKCEKPTEDFKDVRTIIETALDHEMGVTKNWLDIADAAQKDKDHDTYQLAQWFNKEQTEEELKFRDILFKINLDMPKWELDELFDEL